MCTPNAEILTDNYRDDLLKSIEAAHNRLTHALELFNAKRAIEPINKEDLKKFPLFMWVPINENIDAYRRKDRFDGYLSFYTRMKKGAEFGNHFHNDLIESMEVVEGEVYDAEQQKFYRKGDIAHFDKGQKHTPIATEKTMLDVLFKP